MGNIMQKSSESHVILYIIENSTQRPLVDILQTKNLNLYRQVKIAEVYHFLTTG